VALKGQTNKKAKLKLKRQSAYKSEQQQQVKKKIHLKWE
jgi:hypothetical protein